MSDDKTPEEVKEQAKQQNKDAKFKQRLEQKEMKYNSPEELRGTGGDINPSTKVVPSTPDPVDNEEYRGTKYDGHGGKR